MSSSDIARAEGIPPKPKHLPLEYHENDLDWIYQEMMVEQHILLMDDLP